MDKLKTRCFVMVLYPDDPSHFKCIELLTQGGYTFAGILHDQDTWSEGESEEYETGTLKKAHWHVVLRFRNPRYRESVAKELGISANYLEPCKNMDSALLYLVHEGYDDKFQYDLDSVFGSLKDNLERLLLSDNENDRVITIVNMIDSVYGKASYRDILLKACNAGLYGDFRRLGAGIKYLIDEHNAELDLECQERYDHQVRQIDKDEFAEMTKWYHVLKQKIDNL